MDYENNVTLKKNTLLYSAIGAGMIVLGSVMMLNSSDEGGTGNALFLGGWVVFLFSLLNKEQEMLKSKDIPYQGSMSQSTFMGIIGGILIVFSELMLRQSGETIEGGIEGLTGSTPGILSLVGWVVLSLSVASEPGTYNPRMEKFMITIPSAAMIIYALLVLIPEQISSNDPVGPGVPLFVLGWFGLVISNSMVLPKLPSQESTDSKTDDDDD
jgi:hypothetical protein